MYQVHRAVNALIESLPLPNTVRRDWLEHTMEVIQYHQARNATTRGCHTQTTTNRLEQLGINVGNLRSCRPPPHEQGAL